jgi:hypothetical protein
MKSKTHFTIAKHILQFGNCFKTCQNGGECVLKLMPAPIFGQSVVFCDPVVSYVLKTKIDIDKIILDMDYHDMLKKALTEWATEYMDQVKKAEFVENLK